MRHYFFLILTSLWLGAVMAATPNPDTWATETDHRFDDRPRDRAFDYPPWFKSSFLNLPLDIKASKAAGKMGIAVYFGQKNCAYCEKLLNINFGKRTDIVAYTQRYFDVIPVDIWGSLDVIAPDGTKLNEQSYADREKTQFTPSLIFYNTDGKEIFRIRGYYPPYTFRAALDYVTGGYYTREKFSEYLERASPPMVFDEGDLNENSIFSAPPYLLDRRAAAQKPLLVLFEQSDCHACNVLHSGALQDYALLNRLQNLEVVQLDLWSQTPLITPEGKTTDTQAWARALDIFYTPTLIFFNEYGQEIIRIDSTVQLYRFNRVLEYVESKAYQRYPLFQRWHRRQLQEENRQNP